MSPLSPLPPLSSNRPLSGCRPGAGPASRLLQEPSGRGRPRSRAAALPALAVLTVLAVLTAGLLMGCAYPAPFDNGLYGPQTPQYDRRTLVLVFQQEGTYQPAAGAAVRVEAAAPARLISPAGGRGLTNSYGELTVVVAPAALYDESVLKQGDIVIDYPVDLAVTMIRSGRELGWSVSDNQSFARYRDPLYQGLNRDPDPQPGFMTLTLP